MSISAELLRRIREYIKRTYPDWMLAEIEFVGSGLEFSVYTSYSRRFGNIVIKVPLKRWISNDNDICIDAQDILQQEVQLAYHLRQYSIPVPMIHAVNFDKRGIDFLITEFIENDHSTPNAYEFGYLIRNIHRSDLPSFSLVAQQKYTLAEVLAERIVRRSKVIERLTNVKIDMPKDDNLKEILNDIDTPLCLLHMDPRPENILTKEGHIVGIIDWSNALIGDPRLELARVAEYGFLNDEFLNGYGQPDCFENIPYQIELLYRLDTVIMLSVVFLSEFPQPHIAKKYLKRVRDLRAKLNEYLCMG